MKSLSLLGLAAAATAFVIPDEETLNSLSLEPQQHEDSAHPFWDNVPCAHHTWEVFEEQVDAAAETAKQHIDHAIDHNFDTAVHIGEKFESAFSGQAWLDSANDVDLSERPPHHGPPHRRPHHPPHHGPPNQTVYELISKSKHTTKLAKLIDDYPDLVELLNGTTANFTVFAPTDHAFEKIPKHAPKPPKDYLKRLLTYHVSPEFYPAAKILASRTIPTALKAEAINNNPQRLSTQIGFRGLSVNFYARVVAIDIFGTNGVIHGLDSILLPPPKIVSIIQALPSEFSTLELALTKTGLLPKYNDTSLHEGGTLFAPPNSAFQRLGPRINAFLFSQYGLKYLKALILYHSVPNITLYSDAVYKVSKEGGDHHGPPMGHFHIDLPTGLHGKSLSIDIARWGRLIEIKINAFSRVAVSDGIAYDGVIQVVPNVLIPPKTPGGPGVADDDMDVEDFKERMAPLIDAIESGEDNMEL